MTRFLWLTCLVGICSQAAQAQSVYDESSNQLSLPSVRVGNTIYNDVVITVGELISVGGSYVDGNTTYNLRAAYERLITEAGTSSFGITGESEGFSVTGSGSVTTGALTSTTFEGMPARVRTTDSEFILNFLRPAYRRELRRYRAYLPVHPVYGFIEDGCGRQEHRHLHHRP